MKKYGAELLKWDLGP